MFHINLIIINQPTFAVSVKTVDNIVKEVPEVLALIFKLPVIVPDCAVNKIILFAVTAVVLTVTVPATKTLLPALAFVPVVINNLLPAVFKDKLPATCQFC